MCHIITIVLAGSYDIDEINRLAEEYAIKWVETSNSCVKPLLQAGEKYYANTRGGCDCGTGLCDYERLIENRKDRTLQLQRDEAKLKKKGWSKTKIERWKEQKLHGSTLSEKPQPGGSCRFWAEFINLIFDQTNITRFGILLHFYSHGVSDETFESLERKVRSRNQLTPKTLFRMKEDTLNLFLKR